MSRTGRDPLVAAPSTDSGGDAAAVERDGSCRDIAAAILKVRLRRDGLGAARCGLMDERSVQLGDAAGKAWWGWGLAADRAVGRERSPA
jgi:hypothetical protein